MHKVLILALVWMSCCRADLHISVFISRGERVIYRLEMHNSNRIHVENS